MTFSFGGIGSHSRSDKKIIKESVIHLYVHVCVCVCVCVCVWVKGQATCRTPKTIWETRINICHMHLAEMYVGNKRKYLSVIDQLRSVSNCWPLIGWWMEVQQIYRQFYGYMVERSVQDMNSWIWYGWFWWSIEYIYIEHVYTYLYLIRGGYVPVSLTKIFVHGYKVSILRNVHWNDNCGIHCKGQEMRVI